MAEEDMTKNTNVTCVDCNESTNNYYTTSINSGKINRCSNCHELWVIRSTRYDLKFSDVDET